jgi:hypothetical protein
MPITRRPVARQFVTNASAACGLPTSSAISSAIWSAPPCNGPNNAPIAADNAADGGASVEDTTRAANVPALKL